MVKQNEKDLICALSRITMEEKELDIVKQCLDKGVDWEYVFNVTLKNKIHLLVFKNLEAFSVDDKKYDKYSEIVMQLRYMNKLRIQKKYGELNELQKKVGDTFDIVPVKGAYLIEQLYKDYSIRSTNDFDLLIRKRDISKLDNVMEDLGYIQGEYNKKNNQIEKVNKEKKILYKTKMYNLLPYIKKFEEKAMGRMVFDVSHALDFDLDTRPIEEMLSEAERSEVGLRLRKEHLFIHLCCHHYREASHASWIMLGKDLNLIKFCDVREFIIREMNGDNIKKSIEFAKKYGLEKAVYFTVYFVKEIYNDGYEDEILTQLGIVDTEFLYQYGENEYDEIQTRKKDFWTSLFAENNIDELIEKPKYDSLIEIK